MTEAVTAFTEMPALPDFSHARLESVTAGPRRAVTLELSPLVWEGHQGGYGSPLTVRLGGIVGVEEIAAFFAQQRLPAEIAKLNYASGHISKPGSLFLELAFERVEAQITISCRNVMVASFLEHA